MDTQLTDGIPQMWSTEEIRDLILYAKDMEQQLEDMKANLITMDAKLKNEESKVKKLMLTINFLTNGNRN